MSFFLLCVFLFSLGILPSFLWLLFYLRKDVHPEPKELILKVFLWGMASALPALFLEKIAKIPEKILIENNLLLLASIFHYFLGVALIEEFLKYLVVKNQIQSHPEFDEPTDAMIYMICAGLGFAASENILRFVAAFFEDIQTFFAIWFIRFFTATFLHALCAGVVGYFLALSFFRSKKQIKPLIFGLTIAILLHGFYDFSIIKIKENPIFLIFPFLILGYLAILVSNFFQKLKRSMKIS